MPWFKVDDSFHSHPKVMELSVEAVGLWTLAGTWCANYLTDGVIKESVLHRFGRTSANVRELCDELVNSGLWDEISEGIFQYRDWADYQPVKADVESEREAARERMRQVRAQKKNTKRSENVQPNNLRTSGEVRVTPTRPDPSLLTSSPTPSSTTEKDKKKKETKLPHSWKPTTEHERRAREKNLNINDLATDFRLHAETHDRRCANWNSAFTMWIRKANPRQATAWG